MISFLWTFVSLSSCLCDASSPPTKATVSLTRGLVNPHLQFDIEDEQDGLSIVSNDCDLQMDHPIIVSHPQSLVFDDRYFVLGSTSYEAVAMTVDYINSKRCGVRVQGQNYPIVLQTLSDDSNPAKHAAAGEYLANRTDFFLAGYSSLLTQYLAPIAQSHQRIMVAGGSSRTSVYQEREYAFGILPPGHLYLDQALEAVASVGAKTVASIAEDGLGFICNAVPTLTEKYGLYLTEAFEVDANPSQEQLSGIAGSLKQTDPDVVVTCTFDGGCARWIQSMREQDWSPKAQVFTLCIGLNELEQVIGLDVTYMMGASSWDKNLPAIPDAVTMWTPWDFNKNFEAYAFKNATYQNAAAATSLSILVQAIELADSIDSALVQKQLASNTFTTLYGSISFDENGQNRARSALFQYDDEMKLHVVYPPEHRPSGVALVYPMPTFRHRDCMRLSSCQATGGTCLPDGTCDCSSADLIEILGGDWEQDILSLGIGPTASCKLVPNESFSYITDLWKFVGYGMVAIQGLLTLIAILWTIRYREKPVVIASQPMFLILTAIGCFIMVASILPSSVEGEYRYIKDDTTGLPTNQTNPDIDRVDAACMLSPWLAGMGFAILFSSLFAKILRIKYMLDHASGHKKKAVGVKDVLITMFVMIFIEAALLLAWQLIDPMRWEREVLLEDTDGFALQSVGSCQSENGVAFYAPLVAINALGLIYALWLCYVTRFVPSDFAEGRWLTISVVSIFQILLLAVPVLVIAEDDPTASFFVRAGVVFLMGSSVIMLIFIPKMRALAFGQEHDGNAIRVRFKEAVELHKEAKSSSKSRNSSGRQNASSSEERKSRLSLPRSSTATEPQSGRRAPRSTSSTITPRGPWGDPSAIEDDMSETMSQTEVTGTSRGHPVLNHIEGVQRDMSEVTASHHADCVKEEPLHDSHPSFIVHEPGEDFANREPTKTCHSNNSKCYSGYDRNLVHRIHERRRQAWGILEKFSESSHHDDQQEVAGETTQDDALSVTDSDARRTTVSSSGDEGEDCGSRKKQPLQYNDVRMFL